MLITLFPTLVHYTTWSDTLAGEKGKLDLNYWVLDYEGAGKETV
jgi:hypothetical protein